MLKYKLLSQKKITWPKGAKVDGLPIRTLKRKQTVGKDKYNNLTKFIIKIFYGERIDENERK